MALPNGDLITTVFDPQMAYPVDKRMQVDTLNSRDSISMFIRWEGMTVYVLENSKIYILQGGRSNEYWKELGTGSGTGGTTFVGQFPTADLLPTSGRSAGDYAFVGTGEDFVQYNWDNIANEWVMAEGQTDMASEFFHIGYKTPLRRPVIFPLFRKDVLVETSGDFVFAPETAVARFIFVGEVEAIRGIETAEADREIKLVNRTGSDIPLRDKASGIPSGSGMDFGGTDYTWVNGSEITLKGNGTYWELAPNNQIAFSDHLDSVNAQVSVGSDGLETISGVFDNYTSEYVSFKEISFIPDVVDGIVFIQTRGKYFKRTGKYNAEMFGAIPDIEFDNTTYLQSYIDTCCRAGQLVISINRSYYTRTLTLNSNHSGIILSGGELICLKNIDGNVRESLIRIHDESKNIYNVSISDFKLKGFAIYTNSTENDRLQNIEDRNNFSGIVASAHTNGRIIGLNINNISGESLNGTLVHIGGAEKVTIDNIKGRYIGTHPLGVSITAFGPNSSWPSDFNPKIQVGKIEAEYCETVFDFSTTGSSKEDVGANIPLFSVNSAIGRNIRSNSKVHGWWGGTIDNIYLKNDFYHQNESPFPAFRVYNIYVAFVNFGSVYIDGFWRGFYNYATTGIVSISQLIVKNTQIAFWSQGDTNIETFEASDIYSPISVAFDKKTNIVNANISKVRKQKWIDILSGIKSGGYWSSVDIEEYPITVRSDGSDVEFSSLVLNDIGEDIGNTPLPYLFYIYRNNTSLKIGSLKLLDPSPIKVVDLVKIDLLSSSHVHRLSIGDLYDPLNFTSDKIVNGVNGRLITDLKNTDNISEGKFSGDLFNFTLNRRPSDFTWIDSNGLRRFNPSMPENDLDGRLFFERPDLSVSFATYTPVLGNVADLISSYVRFTGSSGAFNINENIFPSGSELIGEVEGGEKMVVGLNGVVVRTQDNQLPRIPTNSRFSIRFKTPNDALLTISHRQRTEFSSSITNVVISSRNYVNYYARFSGNSGNITISGNIFLANDELQGEIEGGAKTFVADAGVTLRYPDGQGLVAPTGSRFIIKFKSSNDALVTIIKPYATTFPELTDTPANYTGHKNKSVKVNNEETALVFVADGVDVRNITDGGSIAPTLTDGFIGSRLNFTSSTAVTLQGFTSSGGQSSLTLVNPHATNNLTLVHNGSGTVKYIDAGANDLVIAPKTAVKVEIVGNEMYRVL